MTLSRPGSRRPASKGQRPGSKGFHSRPTTVSGEDTDAQVLGGEWASRASWAKSTPRRGPKKNQNTAESLQSIYGLGRIAQSSKLKTTDGTDARKSGEGTGPAASMTRTRTVESWLNGSLNHARTQRGAGTTDQDGLENQLQKKMDHKNPGLTHFKVDGGNLASLGLDQATIERIHRTFFVYSQGIHTVLQDVVKHAKDRPQALLILWKALSAVLESGQEGEGDNEEASLADIIKRGNEEELVKIKKEFSEQIATLKLQRDRSLHKNKDFELEILELRNKLESATLHADTHEKESQIAQKKHELEIRKRTAAEIDGMEKSGWRVSLEEDLDKARKQVKHLNHQLSESQKIREQQSEEVTELRAVTRNLETQLTDSQQLSLQDAQQKERFETQIVQGKQRLEKEKAKAKDLDSQLEKATLQKHYLQDEIDELRRTLRTTETTLDDETHIKNDITKQKDLLNKRCDTLEKENTETLDTKRMQQKELYDLRAQVRFQEVEHRRVTGELEVKNALCEKLQLLYKTTLTECRKVEAENENLSLDFETLDKRMKIETESRRQFEGDKVQLQGELRAAQTELSEARDANARFKKELIELTKKVVKVEGSEQALRAAMGYQAEGHSAERKAMAKQRAVLEKVISDERQARRVLAEEAQNADGRRRTALEEVDENEVATRMLKLQLQEAELEADRLKIFVESMKRSQEDAELVAQKNNAAAANCDSELRQLHVLLESERADHKEQVALLTQSSEAARSELIKEIEMWQMRFEDALSKLNFNPLNDKFEALEKKIEELQEEVKHEKMRTKICQEQIEKLRLKIEDKNQQIRQVKDEKLKLKNEKQDLIIELDGVKQHLEQTTLRLSDYEERAIMNADLVANADDEKRRLEGIISQLNTEIERLLCILNRPKDEASVQATVEISSFGGQTDLSYQYLESADHLQEGAKRFARLDNIKKASGFVQGTADQQRDFTVRMRSVAADDSTEMAQDRNQNLLSLFDQDAIEKKSPDKMTTRSHLVPPQDNQLIGQLSPHQSRGPGSSAVPRTLMANKQTANTFAARVGAQSSRSTVSAGPASAAAARLTSSVGESSNVQPVVQPSGPYQRNFPNKQGGNSRAARLVTNGESGFTNPVVPSPRHLIS